MMTCTKILPGSLRMKGTKILLGGLLATLICFPILGAGREAPGAGKDTQDAGVAVVTAEKRLKGSISVEGKHTGAELAKMAKISRAQAAKIALDVLVAKAPEKKVSDCELEVED